MFYTKNMCTCMHTIQDVQSCEYMQLPRAFTRTWATTRIKHVDMLYLGAFFFVLRFINKLRNKEIPIGVPTVSELECAETKTIQQTPKKTGFTRGLPMPSTKQPMDIINKLGLFRDVLRTRPLCKQWGNGPFPMPQLGPIPKDHLQPNTAFEYTGIDYFGPIYAGDLQQKVWICLFVCMTTRAIYVELMSDMTTETFLLGFRRFVARRGAPRKICQTMRNNL